MLDEKDILIQRLFHKSPSAIAERECETCLVITGTRSGDLTLPAS